MKTKERIKTILLIVLLVGAVSLTYMIWGSYTGRQSGDIAEGDGITVASESGKGGVAPFAVSYKTSGVRYGAAYNKASVDIVYGKVAPILTKALSSPEKFTETTEDEWGKALLKDGIILDYEGNVPVDILCDNLGITDSSYTVSARYILISDGRMFFKNTDSKRIYSVKNAVDAVETKNMLVGLTAARCSLAAEVNEERVSAETILVDGKISCYTISSENAAELLSDSQMFNLLKIFGMNYNTCGRHMESDGSRTYVQGLSTLKILPDGYMIYETEGEGEDITLTVDAEGELPTMVEQIEGAGAILRALQGIMGDECELYVREAEGVSLKYGRSFGGIPVDRSGSGYSAELEFSGKGITRIGFSMRNYKSQGSVVYALPQKLAIASAGNDRGRVLSLRYVDTLQGGLDAQWFFKAEDVKK